MLSEDKKFCCAVSGNYSEWKGKHTQLVQKDLRENGTGSSFYCGLNISNFHRYFQKRYK